MDAPAPDLSPLPRAERVLVCVGAAPGSARLVRSGAELAGRLGCPWIAAHVALPAGLSEVDQARVDAHLHLAEGAGAEVARLSGRRTAVTLAAFARDRSVTHLVVGKPGRRDPIHGSLVDELVRASADVDIHVVTGVDGPEASAPARAGPRGVPIREVVVATVLVAAATGVSRLGSRVLSAADIVMLYLLVVVVAAYRLGWVAAITAASLSVAAYNFFFVAPFHTFAVADTRNVLTFVVLFGVGLAASALADRLRRQEADAVAREQRTAALLALTRALAAAPDEAAVASAIVRETSTRLARGAILYLGEGRVAEAGEVVAAGVDEHVALVRATASAVIRAGVHAVPVYDGAVLVLVGPSPGVADLADAYARQAALALTRARHARIADEASLRARAEELRSALLSTVSHDLRTPLAAITGAATTLLDGGPGLTEAGRTELLTSVRDEAERLERLVANLLEMTRLASGALRVRREWVPLEEIIGAAYLRVERLLGDRPVHTDLAPALPLLAVDPILFELVLVNLLENAARHTPDGTTVEISARASARGVEIEVRDHGAGLPPGEEARVFDAFVQGPGSAGSGLGLAICRGIVRAHGGEIRAGRATGGGASFTIWLPTQGEPPDVPLDALEGT